MAGGEEKGEEIAEVERRKWGGGGGGVCELWSAAETRRVLGSWRGKDGN